MNSPDRNDSDATQTIFLSGPQSLARILAQDEPDAALWEPQEMRAMWQHQMRAPIEADLAALRASRPGRFSDVAGGEDKSFADVLQAPKAPLALLKLIKEIAKQMLKEAEDAQLKELAAALYYTSYAAALLRHGQRLGGMSEPELRGGFEWTLGRVWLDEATKGLLRAARESLDS